MSAKGPSNRTGSLPVQQGGVSVLVVVAVATAALVAPLAGASTGVNPSTAAGTEATADYQLAAVQATVENATLEVVATVENEGTDGEEAVELYVFGNKLRTRTIGLAAGEERTVGFSVPTDTLAPGSQPVRVETSTDSETQSVVIDAHTLRIEGRGTDTGYRFHLETTGEPEPNADGERIVEVRQLETGQDGYKSVATAGAAIGAVSGDSDVYIITGELEFIFFTGDTAGRVYLDGEQIDPDDYGVSHTIRFAGNGTSSPYSFELTDTIPQYYDMPDSNRNLIGISGTERGDLDPPAGVGTVYRGNDTYRFIGPLTEVYVGGVDPARVYLDGERIDPNDYGDRQLLRVVGNGTAAEYSFTTTGSVSSFLRSAEEYAYYLPGDRATDEVYTQRLSTGGYVKGAVRGGSDAYYIEGDIDGLEAPPGVTVYLDGERIDPADYNETDIHEIRFVGAGDGTIYDFSVDGEIFDAKGLGPFDGLTFSDFPVESNTGFVSGGTDVYYYRGAAEPTSLTVNGNATVFVDGEEVNPNTVG